MKEKNTTSTEEARRFFLDRLTNQAAAEGNPLTRIELQYLDYSRIESEEESDRVEAAFDAKFDYDEFADRIVRLLRAALKQDSSHDSRARALYQQHLKALKASPRDGQLYSFTAPAFGVAISGAVPFVRMRFWLVLGFVLLVALGLILWDSFSK